MNKCCLLALALGMVPLPVAASCNAGAPLAYGDIGYVAVTQASLTQSLHPWFNFEAVVYPAHGSVETHGYGWLSAKRAVKLTGDFVAADPLRTFAAVMAVLEADNFLAMRLTPTAEGYIDGPEDAVTVVGCGVTWTLGTAGGRGFVRLDDAQGRAFFKLEDDLRNTIFSAKWVRPGPKSGAP